jgi:hypothetical protein
MVLPDSDPALRSEQQPKFGSRRALGDLQPVDVMQSQQPITGKEFESGSIGGVGFADLDLQEPPEETTTSPQ